MPLKQEMKMEMMKSTIHGYGCYCCLLEPMIDARSSLLDFFLPPKQVFANLEERKKERRKVLGA